MKTLFTLFSTILFVSLGLADEKVTQPEEYARFNAPQVLTDGYQVILERPPNEQEGNYRLLLKNPDMTEDVIWSPPNRQPHNRGEAFTGASVPVNCAEPLKALVANGQLGVIILLNDRWWWLRWDIQTKRRLPFIEFFNDPTGMRLHLLDANTVELLRGKRGKKFTLTANAEGRLFKDGKPWLEDVSYSAYGDSWVVSYGDLDLDGRITRIDSPKGWPYITKHAIRPPVANPQEPPRDSVPSLPVPVPIANTPPAASQPSAMSVAQTAAVLAEPRASAWLWVVGIVALLAAVALILKRKTSKPQ